MDFNPDSKLHFAAKAAYGKTKTISLDGSDGKSAKCMNKCKENSNAMEVLLHNQNKALKGPEDVEIDITGCTNKNDTRTVKTEDPDATDYSSSFANTMSDIEKCSGLSDAEVESQFIGDADFPPAYDSFSSLFHTRKKRLTNHWRGFIQPLMWRCKWTELRIKQIESQALKYSRELAAYDERKFSQIDQSTQEGFCTKSLPFSSQSYRRKVFKRRRRKRIEETTDIASYMACHNLFSYLEHKKSIPDCTYVADDFGNTAYTEQPTECTDKFGMNNDQLLLEFRVSNNSLEQILWKIEIVRSKVLKLRSQLDLVMSKNASKFSSSENLSLLAACDAQTSSAPSPTFSAGNGDTLSMAPEYNTTNQISTYDVGDLVIPGRSISNFGEAFHVPDIIESTVGLLSSIDVTCPLPQIADSCENIVENVLIQNEGNAGNRQVLRRTNSQPIIKQHHQSVKVEEEESINPFILTSEPNHATKSIMSQDKSTLWSCLASDICFPKNKRKRGERKAGSGAWSKKHSGEPASQ